MANPHLRGRGTAAHLRRRRRDRIRMVARLLQSRIRLERRSRPPAGRRGRRAARQGDPQDSLPRRRSGLARRRLPAHLHRRRCERRCPPADRWRGRRRLSGLVPRRLEHRLHLRPGREQRCQRPQRRIRRPRVGRHPALLVRRPDQRRRCGLVDGRAQPGRHRLRRRRARFPLALPPDAGRFSPETDRRLDKDVLLRDGHRAGTYAGRPHSLRRRGEGRGAPLRARRSGRSSANDRRRRRQGRGRGLRRPGQPGPSSRPTLRPPRATST